MYPFTGLQSIKGQTSFQKAASKAPRSVRIDNMRKFLIILEFKHLNILSMYKMFEECLNFTDDSVLQERKNYLSS